MNEKVELVGEADKNSLFEDWKKYYLRWTIFGFFAGALQPVLNDDGGFWTIKLWQALSGVPFGIVCAVMFTFLQNKINQQRMKYKTWGLLFVTWMVIKFVFAGVYLAL